MSGAPFEARVARLESVTPCMRRLVLAGPGLSGFRVPAGALGPYLKLHLSDEAGRPVLRTYSVRRHDPARAELHIDMLLHGAASPGSRLALQARPGDRVTLAGPGFIPAQPCRDYLLAGDHTALPAIQHIVENLPAGRRVRAFLEVSEAGDEQPLAGRARTEVTWLHRPDGQPSRLAEAVRDGWPAGADDLLVFVGAEAGIARAIRGLARRRPGLQGGRCQVLNYWKTGQPEGGFSYVA